MLTILQGENELLRQEALSDILNKAHMTLDLRALNTEFHEGTPTLGELRQTCSPLPRHNPVHAVGRGGLLRQRNGV